jgi:hypothetical protein
MASGESPTFSITAAEALAFATEASQKFKVGPDRTVAFDSPLANRIREFWADAKAQAKLKDVAKLRPLTMAELDDFEKTAKAKESKKTAKRTKNDPSQA